MLLEVTFENEGFATVGANELFDFHVGRNMSQNVLFAVKNLVARVIFTLKFMIRFSV